MKRMNFAEWKGIPTANILFHKSHLNELAVKTGKLKFLENNWFHMKDQLRTRGPMISAYKYAGGFKQLGL